LVCPVTDCTFDRPSCNENATGYFLTRSLMYWFWDIYCSPADRTDPRASPLRGKLEGLPPAFVVTCEFDPRVTRVSRMPKHRSQQACPSSN
jgi:acetyl esterase/lipase